MILDDEVEFPNFMAELLRNLGYTAIPATDPMSALRTIKDNKPSIVFFDYRMPDMDGLKFLKEAKQIAPDAFYVLFTAYRDDVTLEKFKEIGVDRILMKPLELEQIIEIIKDINSK